MVSCGQDTYERFKGFVRSTVTVFASEESVRIMRATECVAAHRRSWGRGETIEDERHIADLKTLKIEAGQHRRTHLLSEVAPSSTTLLRHVAERNQPLHRATALLTKLLDTYGAQEFEAAIHEALVSNAPHPHAVRLVLERRRQDAGKSPALPLPLTDRGDTAPVRPHSLSLYDSLMKKDTDDDNT
jgi:hypothetical protein